MASNLPENATPAQCARALAEAGPNPTEVTRSASRTFALVAIAEALEGILNAMERGK